MPFPSPSFLDQMRHVPGLSWVVEELQLFYALLEGWLRKEHRADGGHRNITGYSLTLTKDDDTGQTGAGTVEGDLAVSGDITAHETRVRLGERDFIGLSGAAGSMVRFDGGEVAWAWAGLADSWDAGAVLASVDDAQGALAVYRIAGATRFEVNPPAGSTWTHQLGNRIASSTRWDEIAASTLYGHSGLEERGRTTALGVWTTVAHDAGNFTGSGSMTWGVGAGDQDDLRFSLSGMTLELAFKLSGTTIGGTISTDLQITLPGSAVIASGVDLDVPVLVNDNGGGWSTGVCRLTGGASVVAIRKLDGSNWSTATDATAVSGLVAVPIA